MHSNISLKFHYSQTDIVQAYRADYRSRLLLWLDIPAIILLSIWGMYLSKSPEMKWYTVASFSAAGVLAVIIIAAFGIIPYQMIRMQTKYRDEYELTFSPEGIHFQTVHIDSQLNWSIYTYARINAHSYLLYNGPRTFSIIPKRVFEGAERQSEFEELIAQKIPKLIRN